MPNSPRVYPLGKTGLGFKPYFGKSVEYWVIKYFKFSDVQNCENLWILRQIIKNMLFFLHRTYVH